MQLNHPKLVDLLKQAYSAEKAASFAYQGHAASVKSLEEKKAIRQIELDECLHKDKKTACIIVLLAALLEEIIFHPTLI